MEALLRHQGESGAWHQVIDRRESYREFTATSMIAFAMLRGLRSGWLDHPAFRQAVDRAWTAIKKRTAATGSLVDVCASTGKQPSLRHYYDRPAILGVDARGGAMALLLATEMIAATPPPAAR
jgi:rhamnogalacturonyl hydrolase YesR